MKVLTVDNDRLRLLCRDLLERAGRLSGKPDCVIGIATGGVYVARILGSAPVFEIECRRPSTERKQAPAARKLLASLPSAVSDMLRKAEHYLLTLGKHNDKREVKATTALKDYLSANPKAHVLVVDDAVDSGATMKAVVGWLESVAPEVSVTTAAVTVTTPSPALRPDVAIFEKGILCRFPWSADFKSSKKAR